MTEAEWLTTTDVDAMLAGLFAHSGHFGLDTERARAFARACAYRARFLLGADLRRIVELSGSHINPDAYFEDFNTFAEQMTQESIRVRADGADDRVLSGLVARRTATLAGMYAEVPLPLDAASNAARYAAQAVELEGRIESDPPLNSPILPVVDRWNDLPESAAERAAQSDLLRCVFGNPFRPVAFDPSWRTEAVVGLARGIDEANDFGALPVLADALEDAGCADAGLLAHCRGPGPHARGCHVVDHVLGKW